MPTSAAEPFVVLGDAAVEVTITNGATGALTSTTKTTTEPPDPGHGVSPDAYIAGAGSNNPDGDTSPTRRGGHRPARARHRQHRYDVLP